MIGLPAEIEIDVIALLSAYGISDITIAGKEICCSCPFHNEITPSFFINRESGLFHCFGCESNGGKGSIISLVRKLERCSEETALRKLLDFATEIDPIRLKEKLLGLLSEEKEIIRNYKMFDYYHNLHKAMEYLQQERNIDIMIIRDSKIGWDDKRNSIVIPVNDGDGHNVALIRRNINKKQYRYSSGVNIHDFLYRIRYKKRKPQNVVIVEGPIDLLKVETAIYRNNLTREYTAVSLLGSKVSFRQLETITREYNNISLMLDNDDAGKYGMGYFVRIFKEKSYDNSLSIIEIPTKYKDPGEMKDDNISMLLLHGKRSIMSFKTPTN